MSIVFNNKPIKVTRHGNTRYEVRIVRKSLGLNHRSFHKTLREAKAKRQEIQDSFNTKQYAPDNKRTFADAIDWIKKNPNELNKLIKFKKKGQNNQETIENYFSCWKNLSTYKWKSIKIQNLTSKLIHVTLLEFGKTKGWGKRSKRFVPIENTKTYHHYLLWLHHLFEIATEQKWIGYNPIKKLQDSKITWNFKRKRLPTEQEIKSILTAIRKIAEARPDNPVWDYFPLFLRIVIELGPRKGEVHALEKSDITILDENIESHRKALSMGKGIKITFNRSGVDKERLKNDDEKRVTFLPKELSQEVIDLMNKHPKDKKLFPKHCGASWDPAQYLDHARKVAGIKPDENKENITFHSFWHLKATLFAEQGKTHYELMAALGWKSIQTTTTYVKTSEELILNALS